MHGTKGILLMRCCLSVLATLSWETEHNQSKCIWRPAKRRQITSKIHKFCQTYLDAKILGLLIPTVSKKIKNTQQKTPPPPPPLQYDGDWVYGKRHGTGTYFYTDGSQYEGEWVDDKVHNRGTCTYASGNKYVGEWSYGKINGRGTLHYVDGDRYAHSTGLFLSSETPNNNNLQHCCELCLDTTIVLYFHHTTPPQIRGRMEGRQDAQQGNLPLQQWGPLRG